MRAVARFLVALLVSGAPVSMTGCRWDWDQFARASLPDGSLDGAPETDAGPNLDGPGADGGAEDGALDAMLAEDAAPSPLGPSGRWRLTFREECDGTTLDRTKWNTQFYSESGGFRQYSWSGSWVDDGNLSLADGHCRFKLERRPQNGAPYTSAAMDTTNKFEQRHGYFEVRLKAPRGLGLTSFATLSAADAWPPRIDFVVVQGGEPDRNKSVVFYSDSGTRSETVPAATADYTADFHVFGVDWQPTAITFYVDGMEVGRATRAAPTINRKLRLEITNHVGGENRPNPDAMTPFPSYMLVDWVRVYEAVR